MNQNDDFLPDNIADNSNHSEDKIQADCFQWFHNTFPALRGLLYAVPNGGKRNKREANKLKATGVVRGVPDMEFHFYRRTFFFEMKTEKGTVKDDQEKIHFQLAEHGFRTWVVRSLEHFQNIIYAILEDKSPRYETAMTREQFEYRHNIFMYIYSQPLGVSQQLAEIVAEENLDKFKGYVIEFMTDGYDVKAGFELLFTPDFLAFYKKSLTEDTNVVYNGFSTVEIPKQNEG